MVFKSRRDLDICIRPGLQSWERVARVISPIHPRYALTPDKRAFEPSGEELLRFRNLYVLTDLGRIDFLGEVPPLGEIDAVLTQAETYELDGRPVHVIGLEQLLRVKEHIRRPKDLEVAVQLRALLDLRKRGP